LTCDELIDDAPTVTELGFDHYFFDPLIGAKALALVRVLEEGLRIAPAPPAAAQAPRPGTMIPGPPVTPGPQGTEARSAAR
jgi:hypothetical protein